MELKPITRQEKIIAGQDLKPITRMEKFLKKFGGGGGSATSLSKQQINALDALFKAASYIKDASAEYAAFCDAFGLVNPDEPEDRAVVIDDIRLGAVSFTNGHMAVGTQAAHVRARATLIPIGQYLKVGATYRVSLGSASNAYFFGVVVYVAQYADITFDYEAEQFKEYTNVTDRVIDDGWMNTDYTFTVNKENCILAVNFKNSTNSGLSEDDYKTLLDNFTIEEVV